MERPKIYIVNSVKSNNFLRHANGDMLFDDFLESSQRFAKLELEQLHDQDRKSNTHLPHGKAELSSNRNELLATKTGNYSRHFLLPFQLYLTNKVNKLKS